MKKSYVVIAEWILLLLAAVCLTTGTAEAQTGTGPVVSVTSKPSGATVILTGDLTMAGVTPTTFSQKLTGLYQVTAHHEGYETYHSSVVFSGRDAMSIDIKMAPKTRVKAAVRSLVFPGWGQNYTGSKRRGAFLTVGTVAAGAVAGILQLRYTNRRNKYDDFNSLYNQTRSAERRQTMLAKLYAVQKDAYNAERNRNTALGVVAAIWAYNVLDAILFFPDYGLNVSGTTLGLYPDQNLDGVRIVGTVKF
jgi:hypothetical protein